MGLFKRKSGTGFSGIVKASVGTTMYKVTRTEKQRELLRQGYKENLDNEIFPPDTVWFSDKSKKYYHSADHCGGYGITDAVPYPEAEAVRRGLCRCKKCEWRGDGPPAPSKRPLKPAKPVSKAKVTAVRGRK